MLLIGPGGVQRGTGELIGASEFDKVMLADWSVGDLVAINSGAIGNVGIKADIRHGTAADPFTKQGSTVHVSQVSAITQAEHDTWAGYGAGGQNQDIAALSVGARGTAGSEMQVSAIAAVASNAGTKGQPDATPLFTYAWQRDAGATGRAIGGYSAARSDLEAGHGTGYEVQIQNNSGAFVPISKAGVSRFVGHLISAGSGFYDGGGAGIEFHHPIGWAQLDVGIHAASNDGGSIKYALIVDDATSEYGIDIRGVKSKAAIKIGKDAGGLVIGADELSASTALFELHAGGVPRDPIFKITAGGKVNTAILFNNTISQFHFGQAGVSNGFLTGTAGGDAALELPEANSLHVGRVGARASLRVGTNIRVGAGAADSFGEGVGVLFFANAETAPKSDPENGVILYPAAGTLTLRSAAAASLDYGSKKAANLGSGTATTDAANFGQVKSLAGAYRTLHFSAGRATSAAAAGTKYFLLPGNADISSPGPQASTPAALPFLFIVAGADLAGVGTPKMRVSAICTTGTKPEMTISVGLYPVTAGATQSLGTVVEGSAVEIEKPAANSNTAKSGADFTVPADGVYALGYTVSGTPAVAFALQAKAEYHHV